MKGLLWLAALASGTGASAALPEEYHRNPDVRTEVTAEGDTLSFVFGFRDSSGAYTEWAWSDSAAKLDAAARSFGLENRAPGAPAFRPEDLARGLYQDDSRLGLLPDYNALVARYLDSVTPLYEHWKKLVDGRQLARRDAVANLLAFLQDFPYGAVPRVWEDRRIGGLFVPPLVFKNGWADCDSKALLMATVLAHDPDFRDRLAMILVPGHALLGIEMERTPYDEAYRYENRDYVIAEPTGLARTPLGRRNSPYSEFLAVKPLHPGAVAARDASLVFTPPPKLVAGPVPASGLHALTGADCPRGGVLTDTHPPGQLRVQSCYINHQGQIVKEGPELRFDQDGKPAERRDYSLGKRVK